MAGNKKPSRKKGGPPKTAGEFFGRLAEHTTMRERRIAKLNQRIQKKNDLPLGHPLNKHKIDKTFKPLEQVMVDQEEGRGMLADADGRLVIYDEDDQEFVPFVPGILHMCHLYDKIGGALTWSRQPPGLRAFTLKLGRGEKVNQLDVDDARATINWMRDRIATVSPRRWTELFEWACALDEEKEAANG
jgi:hypothetical protein